MEGEEGTNQGHKMSLLHSIGPIDDDDDQLLILLENWGKEVIDLLQ